eukprot:TRINITY_DN8379_c0_g1_i1.p1 TRINITY_DN8379_c0_g1~~TRINITY_DN8379_c0_g1_i1.p1  ORF type:complete len:333 (-),score=30.21 TRINITY_DN8379_c0_g1_i1:119-1117(-)
MEEATSLKYWIRWNSVVCEILVFIAIAAALTVIYRVEYRSKKQNARAALYHAYIYDDGELWKPCWRNVSPKVLLVVRAFLFLLMAGFMSADVVVHTYRTYFYYTEWTFTLVAIYFAFATVVSLKGCIQSSKQDFATNRDEVTDFLKTDLEQGGHIADCSNENLNECPVISQTYDNPLENRKKAGCFGFTMQIIFQICGGAVMMTDIVFWAIIVPFLTTDHFKLNLLMACMHSVNFVCLMIDVSLSSMNFPWFRGAYFVLWTASYVVFQWILHACGFPWWPYPFLKLSTSWAPLWYLGLAVVCIAGYGVFGGLVKLKQCLFPKLFPHSYCCFS